MFSTKKKPKNKGVTTDPGTARKGSDEDRAGPIRTEKRNSAEESRAARSASRAVRGNSPSSSSSTLNPHLAFEGDLKFTGTVLVDCDLRGSIVTDDTLVVGVSGKVHAEVTAGRVEISGKIHGNIKAKNGVKIFSGGEVHGNIETPTISMEEGVVFEGNCTRPAAAPRPQQAPQFQQQPPKIQQPPPESDKASQNPQKVVSPGLL